MNLIPNADKKFLQDTPSNKGPFGQHIIDSLVANPTLFLNLPYTVNVLKTANTLLINTTAAARSGDHAAIITRNNAEKDWNDKFGKTADYVSFLANGNELLITQAGFTPTKGQSTPTDLPGQAMLAKLTPHDGGILEITMAPPTAGKVSSYIYTVMPNDAQIITAADGTITIALVTPGKISVKCDTHNTTTMGGLEVGKMMKLVVQPVNNKGVGPASVPKSFILQP